MSHSMLCRLSGSRLVGAAHRAAVNLAIGDISVRLWGVYHSRRCRRRCGWALYSAG